MKISRLYVKNYRNIKLIDIKLSDVVTVIGENNSGKSNLLRALTLPFLADDAGYMGKTLSWIDINNEEKQRYYDYLLENKERIVTEQISIEEFSEKLPVVIVEVTLKPEETEVYYVKDLSYAVDAEGSVLYGIRYEYKPKNVKQIYELVIEILKKEEISKDAIEKMKMNLLPTDMYSYSITVPAKGSVSYDVLKQFRYTSLVAERDDFSTTNDKVGSKSLIKLLQMKLSDQDKLDVEKEYSKFFDFLKKLSGMENIINWQEHSDVENAKEFFEKISILPNMPPMNSIVSSVRLGYAGDNLSLQGLGQRNLILLLVLMNSLLGKKEDVALNVLTMEEPEAHLCINNIRLMISFIKAFTKGNNGVQLFYSTHNTEFINKLDLKNIVIVSDGQAYALGTELDDDKRNYLSKNPNLDLFKLFFSRKCILVEGLTEELLIRAYLDSKKEINDVEVISFHKGFSAIIEIWLKVNNGGKNRLGIVRDFDNQENAQKEHEKYNRYSNVCVKTTVEYTLEPEIVKTGDNYSILKEKYGDSFGWENLTEEELADNWRSAKSEVMLQVCKDLACGELPNFAMPEHIETILEFLEGNNSVNED